MEVWATWSEIALLASVYSKLLPPFSSMITVLCGARLLCISALYLQSEVLKEELLDGNHVVISVELNDGISCLPTHAQWSKGVRICR